MIRHMIVLGLIGASFGAGVYVGVTVIRPRAPLPARVPGPAAPPPAPKPAAEAPRGTRAAPAARSARGVPTAPSAATAPEPEAPDAADPLVGALTIDSDVPGAQVFIDRQFVGAAPVKARQVARGSHRVNVSAPGYEGVAETIDVEAGPRSLMFKLREVRLDASIDVVHRHRLGSCRGRLVATPLGLRYDASESNDAFTATLANLETLEVDYLKKNLKVKIKGGRTFDFTDPAGDADRLFVFHRDVATARERIVKGDPPAQP